jgi:hypothetical protein
MVSCKFLVTFANVWCKLTFFLFQIDYWILPDDPLSSFWMTTCVGAGGCFSLYAGASLLAPPAIFLLDGPSINPPPVAVTIVSSYYSLTVPAGKKSPDISKVAISLDVFVSFIVLPILVVSFWRGVWYLEDHYFWGFTDEPTDMFKSIGYSTLVFVICLGIASEDAVYWINVPKLPMLRVLDRLQTLILAVGAVSFWRAIWFLWDESFRNDTSHVSAWVSHFLGVVGLVMLGCFSCVAAPPSTLGVDAIPCEGSAYEPLFSNIPVASETLVFCAIGRQPRIIKRGEEPRHDDSGSEIMSQTGAYFERQRPGLSERVDLSSLSPLDTAYSDRNHEKRKQNVFAVRSR